MDATTQHQSLQRLAQQLQFQVRSLSDATPMQMQCVVKQGNLMVLGQHPPEAHPDPQVVFGALEQALHDSLPALSDRLALGDEAQAKLYLRVLGQQQPYASHSFQLPLPAPEPLAFMATATSGVEALDAGLQEAGDRADLRDQDSPQDHVNEDNVVTTDSIYDPTYVERSDLATLDPVLASSIDDTPAWSARSALLPWLLAGVGVSVAGFATGLWVMSRPCMWGTCEPLQTAQTLSQQSLQAMQTAKTGQALQQAQQQLTEATRLLQTIPIWSGHHGAAETLQQTYRSQAETLDLVLAAEAKANTATQTSQSLPQPVAGLQSAQTLWREAIAQLQTIPQSSPLHPFAQQRLANYAANVGAIDKLTSAEKAAQRTLATAKETVNVAEARQGMAQSPETWQLAQSTWQVAINTLQEIPNATTSYAEAQKLLTEYQPKLAAVRDRATKEQIAQKTFTQATALAQKAEAAQTQNQWSQAVVNWRDALTNMKQVPASTAYADPAQPLIASYTNALKQAEAQLQVANAVQQTRNDLNRICTGASRMCSYTIDSSVIRVQFTPTYERQLRTAFLIGQSGDRSTLGGAINHIETLQTALQTIANNAGLPLEVYNADGSELIGSFNPKG